MSLLQTMLPLLLLAVLTNGQPVFNGTCPDVAAVANFDLKLLTRPWFVHSSFHEPLKRSEVIIEPNVSTSDCMNFEVDWDNIDGADERNIDLDDIDGAAVLFGYGRCGTAGTLSWRMTPANASDTGKADFLTMINGTKPFNTKIIATSNVSVALWSCEQENNTNKQTLTILSTVLRLPEWALDTIDNQLETNLGLEKKGPTID